jgi:phosphopantetheine adenylyltransferase
MQIDEIIGRYIEARDKKKQIMDEAKERAAKIDAVLNKIEAVLLAQFEKLGTDSMKTPHGTAYKTVKSSYAVADWDATLDFIRSNGLWHILERRVAKAGVDAYKDETGELLPGLNARTEVAINIRRS